MSSDVPATTDPTGVVDTALNPDEATGLEDFDTSDFVMPRIGIDHKKGVFKDNLTGEEHTVLTGILLGLVKQRVLWDAEVDDDAKPLCKSYNFTEGYPDRNTFPWKASGFDKDSVPEDATLPCANCALKEWNSHPKRDSPWCSEQWAMPFMVPLSGGGYAPALLTFQRSSLKPAKAYTSSFARAKKPMFTAVTKIELTQQKRGNVDYAVPSFVRVDDAPAELTPLFRENLVTMRDFISRPYVKPADDDAAPTEGQADAAPTAAVADDDDVPF